MNFGSARSNAEKVVYGLTVWKGKVRDDFILLSK